MTDPASPLSASARADLDADLVRHVAMLVRLGIDAAEAEEFSRQFNEIIAYFQLLNEVDTADVPPANLISSLRSVMRPDEVQPSMPRENLLRNAPRHDDRHIQVPPVFGEE